MIRNPDEAISELEIRFKLEPNLINGEKLYNTYTNNGLTLEEILEKNVLDETLLKTLMLQEIIPINADFLEDEFQKIINVADRKLHDLACESAAQAWSFTDNEDFWINATFGDAEAINGELLTADRSHPSLHLAPPMDYILTDKGGYIPTTEECIQWDHLVQATSQEMDIPEEIVKIALKSRFRHYHFRDEEDDEICTTISGDSEVYIKDPFYDLYSAKNLQELKHLSEQIDVKNLIDYHYHINLDKIPTWGPKIVKVEELIANTTASGGILSWNTTILEYPKYLIWEMLGNQGPHSWKIKWKILTGSVGDV